MVSCDKKNRVAFLLDFSYIIDLKLLPIIIDITLIMIIHSFITKFEKQEIEHLKIKLKAERGLGCSFREA